MPDDERRDFSQPLRELQKTTWEKAGLLRDAEGLSAANEELRSIGGSIPEEILDRQAIELGNLLTVGELIVESALARKESRGAHYRNDFPKRDDAKFGKHSLLAKGEPVSFFDFAAAKVMV